jgi:hypothetical protein
MNRPEPPHPHQMRDAQRIFAVGLDGHGLEGGPDVPVSPGVRLAALQPPSPRIAPGTGDQLQDQSASSPRRARQTKPVALLARDLRFACNPPRAIDNANACRLQRHIQSGIPFCSPPS